eukprot:scaffold5212_cov61-Phaeocystis_antarctica.AAC.1
MVASAPMLQSQLIVSSVERGARIEQPLSDAEVTPGAGLVQRRLPAAVGGVEGGTHVVQPLGDVEVALAAGVVKWCISFTPLGNVEVAIPAGVVQRCPSISVSGVERGARTVQPLGDVEVIPGAGVMQQCTSFVVGGVERGARAVQPLGDVEVALEAGGVKWLQTMNILPPHARAVRHRCLRCRQITCHHGGEQSHVRTVTSARAGCGGGRRLSTRCLHTCICKAGAASRTLGLRPPHEAGQRAAERLVVELDRATMTLQELRRGKAILGLEGGVGPGTAEPLSYFEVALPTGQVQRCISSVVGGVERGTRAVQPLGETEVTLLAAGEPLGDVEVTSVAGEEQRCLPIVAGGVDRGTHPVQPLGDAEVTLPAGEVKWLPTISTLRPHARAVRHRCLRCRQIAILRGVEQPLVRAVHAVACARARCGGGRRLSSRRLYTCKAGAVSA